MSAIHAFAAHHQQLPPSLICGQDSPSPTLKVVPFQSARSLLTAVLTAPDSVSARAGCAVVVAMTSTGISRVSAHRIRLIMAMPSSHLLGGSRRLASLP